MRTLRLRQALNDKRPFLGIQCFIGTPVIIELLGELAFDFVMIDTEHTALNPETVEYMVRVADSVGVTPVIRVGANDPLAIQRALDTGAAGVIVPHVRNAADAQLAVASAKYAPDGTRGVCSGTRANAFSKDVFSRAWRRHNEDVVVIPLLEDLEAIENAESIMATPGVDLVWFGPGDLAQAIRGRHGGSDGPVAAEIDQAFDRVVAASRKTGVPVLSLPFPSITLECAKKTVARGALGMMYSIDALLIGAMLKDVSDQLGAPARQAVNSA